MMISLEPQVAMTDAPRMLNRNGRPVGNLNILVSLQALRVQNGLIKVFQRIRLDLRLSVSAYDLIQWASWRDCNAHVVSI